MTDVHSKEVRSFNMGRIKGKDTKPEILVRRFLHRSGFRYRVHVKDLPGKPDIVLPKYKIVIFVNGCFWHGHADCKYFVLPKTRKEWWSNKIQGNIRRDVVNEKLLVDDGWKIIKIWECQLKTKVIQDTFAFLLKNLYNPINNNYIHILPEEL